MTAPTSGDSCSAAVPATATYTVPRIGGDATAARRLAAAYDDLATTVERVGRRVAGVAADLGAGWRGAGAGASAGPFSVVTGDLTATARALRECADRLRAYAAQLEHAEHHHRSWMHRLVAVGIVVTVSVVAITVTVGAAAVVEAAAASAAAGAAAAGAATAGEVAAGGLLASLGELVSVRALASFVLSHLVSAEINAGETAAQEEWTNGRLDGASLAWSAAAGFVSSVGGAQAENLLEDAGWLAAASPVTKQVLNHLAQGGASAAATTAQELLEDGSVSLKSVGMSAASSGASSAVRDAWSQRRVVPARHLTAATP